MAKRITQNVWKFLSKELTYEQKKEMIQEKNIQIGSLRPQLLATEAQWKVAMSMFDAELSKQRVQKLMVSFYVESIIPEVQKDMDEKASHFEILKEMDISNLEEVIQEHGHIYVVIALILTGQVDKINQLIKEITKVSNNSDGLESNEKGPNEDQINEYRKKVTDLTNTLESLKSAEKKLKKDYKALENKYSDMLDKKNKDIKDLEKKLTAMEDENKNIKEELKLLENKNQSYIESYSLLEEENKKLIKENNAMKVLHEVLEREMELSQKEVHIEKGDDGKDFVKELDVKKNSKGNKKRILVFGDVPITIEKQSTYDVTIFEGDCQNYNFDDHYDEYWYIEDKLTAKEKRQLARNKNSASIQWRKTTYNKTLGM